MLMSFDENYQGLANYRSIVLSSWTSQDKKLSIPNGFSRRWTCRRHGRPPRLPPPVMLSVAFLWTELWLLRRLHPDRAMVPPQSSRTRHPVEEPLLTVHPGHALALCGAPSGDNGSGLRDEHQLQAQAPWHGSGSIWGGRVGDDNLLDDECDGVCHVVSALGRMK